LALSTAGGVLAGVVLSAAISSRRTGIWRESSAIAVLAVVGMSYVSLDFAGGSGYLGAFLAGLIVGNMRMLGLSMHDEHQHDLEITARSIADIVTIFVFVLVGANLPFHEIRDEIAPALAVVAVLLLVARPVTVAICMLPDRRSRWSRAELAFVCWTRETGVVPAALVGVLAALAVPNSELLAAVVALAILVTLLVQAVPAPWLAQRLGLLEVDAPHIPEREIVGVEATAGGRGRH
jgi:cell volume regulation protein A